MENVRLAALKESDREQFILDNQEAFRYGKADGRRYKLAYGKPCRLECGDIIYVALTRLQVL